MKIKTIIITALAALNFHSANAQSKSYIECEDTCTHIHGIDLSHYQGNVFWETIGDNSKMEYVYLKATEGGNNIDSKYAQNIDLAHKYGLKVGSYHFYRPKIEQSVQLQNFMSQCRPGDQDLLPMIDIETKACPPKSSATRYRSSSCLWKKPTSKNPCFTLSPTSTTTTSKAR